MFDSSKFTVLELRMYMLIRMKVASKYELEEWYTLEEALKLYSIIQMEQDIKTGQNEEMKAKSKRK